jgi:hypothetical protein
MRRPLDRLLGGWWARANTARGIAATVCTAGIGALLISSATADPHNSVAGAVGGYLILFPAIWWASWWLVGRCARAWNGMVLGTPPDVKVGRPWQQGGTRQQLREDANARIFQDRGGILLRKRAWFIATGTPPFRLDRARLARSDRERFETPVLIAAFRDRYFWWSEDAFYWTNRAELGAPDVKALLFARERQRERELEHAHAVMAAASAPVVMRKREPIARDVRHAVWKRDEGRCVECASDFDLQYDHVIPFSMGGAATVENLQLLCARCNQAKGGRL